MATLLYPYLTGDFTCGSHTSCDFQPSPLALVWIFFFEHSGHGCSSLISSLNSTQGIWYPNSPRNARKNTWLYRYANLKRYRRMLAERKQREYKMFCSFPTSPCRFSFLSTCACAASRRVAISTSHLYDMSPNHVSEHLLSISDLYIASPLVAAPIGALSVVCVAGGRLCYGVFHVVWVGLGVYIFM